MVFSVLLGKMIQEGGTALATNGLAAVFGGEAKLTNASIHLWSIGRGRT